MQIDKNQTQTLSYEQGKTLAYSALTNGITVTIIYHNPVMYHGILLGGYIALTPFGLNNVVTSLAQLIPQGATVKGLALIGTKNWNRPTLENMLQNNDSQFFYPAYDTSAVGLNHDMIREVLNADSIEDGLLTVIGNNTGIDMIHHKMDNYYYDINLEEDQSNMITVVWKDSTTVEVRLNKDTILNTFTGVGI